MYEFLDRLVNIALPRVRDFRGLSKKFWWKGNYSLNFKEQIVFPEIDYDNLDSLRGMDITIVTSAKNDDQGLELLKVLIYQLIFSRSIFWLKKCNRKK